MPVKQDNMKLVLQYCGGCVTHVACVCNALLCIGDSLSNAVARIADSVCNTV